MPCSPFINCSNNVTSLTDLLIRAMGEVSVGSYAISAIETDDTFENCEIGCDEVQSTETFLRLLLKDNSGAPALGVLTLSGTPESYADCTQYSLLNLINALITKVDDCYYLKIMAVDNFSCLDCQEHQQPLETIFRRSIVKNSEGCLAVAVYFNETGTPVSCDNQIPAPFTILKGAFGKQTTTGIYALRMIGSGAPEPGCPALCGSDLSLVGISDNYTVDGWYVAVDGQELIYLESGIKTDETTCTSGFAALYWPVDNENPNLYQGPYAYISGEWIPMMRYNFDASSSPEVAVQLVADEYFDTETTTAAVEIKNTIGGDWSDVSGISLAGDPVSISSENCFMVRIKVTDVNGCIFYGYGPNGRAVCADIKSGDFQYAVPSADCCPYIIYPTADISFINGYNLSVDIQGSLDEGTTWFNIASGIDPAQLDGLTPFETNQNSLVTRLKLTDPFGCIHYSDINTNTL